MILRNTLVLSLALTFNIVAFTIESAATGSTCSSEGAVVAVSPEPLSPTTTEKSGNPVFQLAGYVKDSVVRTVDGCGLLWKNHVRCNEIRAKQREHREKLQKKWEMEGRLTRDEMKEKLKTINGGITYEEFSFLVKGKEDRSRLMNVAFLMWGAPRFLPYALMFYPEMLPSPFAPLPDGSARESGLEKMSRQRSHAVLQTLLSMEKDAKAIPGLSKINIFGRKAQERRMDSLQELGQMTSRALERPGARGSRGAQLFLESFDNLFFRTTEFNRAENRLCGIPSSIVRGLVLAMDGPSIFSNILPNFMNRGKVISHIKKISEGDDFLISEAIDLTTIDSTHLIDACNERFIGGPGRSDEELRESLGEWLHQAVVSPAARVQETGQFYSSNLATLCMLCYYALDSARDPRSSSYLPRVLFQGQALDAQRLAESNKGEKSNKKIK